MFLKTWIFKLILENFFPKFSFHSWKSCEKCQKRSRWRVRETWRRKSRDIFFYYVLGIKLQTSSLAAVSGALHVYGKVIYKESKVEETSSRVFWGRSSNPEFRGFDTFIIGTLGRAFFECHEPRIWIFSLRLNDGAIFSSGWKFIFRFEFRFFGVNSDLYIRFLI